MASVHHQNDYDNEHDLHYDHVNGSVHRLQMITRSLNNENHPLLKKMHIFKLQKLQKIEFQLALVNKHPEEGRSVNGTLQEPN